MYVTKSDLKITKHKACYHLLLCVICVFTPLIDFHILFTFLFAIIPLNWIPLICDFAYDVYWLIPLIDLITFLSPCAKIQILQQNESVFFLKLLFKTQINSK